MEVGTIMHKYLAWSTPRFILGFLALPPSARVEYCTRETRPYPLALLPYPPLSTTLRPPQCEQRENSTIIHMVLAFGVFLCFLLNWPSCGTGKDVNCLAIRTR